MACACGQSYASAGITYVPVVYRNVPRKFIERAADDDNARKTIRGHGYACHRSAYRAGKGNAEAPKLLNDAGTANGNPGLTGHNDPTLGPGGRSATTSDLWIGLSCDCEGVQVQ